MKRTTIGFSASLAACLTACFLAAPTQLFAAEQATNAQFDLLYRQFASEILFGTDLEGPAALMASGDETPTQNASAVFGEGFRGKCLTSGTLRFSAAQNVIPAAGTLLFWLRVSRPEGVPDPKEPNFWPIFIEFERGQLLAGKQDAFNGAPIYAYLQGHPDVSLVLVNTYHSTKKWSPKDWHLVIVCWQPGELKISLDGQAFVTDSKMPPLTGTPRVLELRAASSPTWSVALDELLILDRPISNEEATQIFRNFQPPEPADGNGSANPKSVQ